MGNVCNNPDGKNSMGKEKVKKPQRGPSGGADGYSFQEHMPGEFDTEGKGVTVFTGNLKKKTRAGAGLETKMVSDITKVY